MKPDAGLPRPPIVLAAAALLLAALLQMKGASAVTSAVVDEPAHLTAGYLSLARFDLSINREHPPLMKALAALPLLLIRPALPLADPSGPRPGSEDFEFDYSRRFLYRANDADRLLAAARAPIMILTLALGLLVFVWAREIAGDAAGLAALFLLCFEPNILAHGRLVTTDLGAAAFSLGFLWTLRRTLRSGSLRWAAAAGAFLGCALLSKFSTLILLPLAPVLCLLEVLAFRKEGSAGSVARSLKERLVPLAKQGATIAAVAWLFLEAGYGFGGFPLPNLYLEGLQLARIKNATIEGPTYLMGTISKEGFWSYYLVALGVKTPLPILLLAVPGSILLWRDRVLRGEWIWILPPAAAWIIAMSGLTRAQIGLRYILPIFPLLCLASGVAVGWLARRSRLLRILPAVLLTWHLAATIWTYPYHLAYFNEIAGGSGNGWKWLADSNLDWGQDLIGLKRRLDAGGNPEINLYYFGTADPDYYGIRHHPYGSPKPGLFAVSATHLTGVYLPDPDYLAGFRAMTPIETIGHSILLYRLDSVPDRLRRPLTRGQPSH